MKSNFYHIGITSFINRRSGIAIANKLTFNNQKIEKSNGSESRITRGECAACNAIVLVPGKTHITSTMPPYGVIPDGRTAGGAAEIRLR